MPYRPASPCPTWPCPNVQPCPVHQVERVQPARPSAHARGYDSAWRRLRAQILAEQPLCVRCDAPATDVDHVISIELAPHLRLEPSNLQPLCHRHHSAKTAAADGGFGNRRAVPA